MNRATALSPGNVLKGVLALVFVASLPHLVTQFVLVQIVIRSLWLGIVAASLIFLVRYAGMISLAQTAIYGTAAYVTANLSVTRGINPWLSALTGIGAAAVLALLIGVISARARGVYFLMLTLAVGVFIYYFALQYRPFTFGFSGINGVQVPALGSWQLREPTNFYFFALVVSGGVFLLLSRYARSPLGKALQADRDCPERLNAVGISPLVVRVAGFTVAGFAAATGGVLSVWFNGQVSPGSMDIVRTINILIIAVLGGVTRLGGAWVGALLMCLLTVYVSDVTDYYNTVIGLVFIIVVLFSPSGAVGITASLGTAVRNLLRAHPGQRRRPITTAPKES